MCVFELLYCEWRYALLLSLSLLPLSLCGYMALCTDIDYNVFSCDRPFVNKCCSFIISIPYIHWSILTLLLIPLLSGNDSLLFMNISCVD